jgi:hypothetical protein
MIKRIFASIFALFCAASASAEPPPQPLPWTQVSEFHFTPSQTRLYTENPVYFGCNLPAPWGQCGSDVWRSGDLKPLGVPADAKFVFLSGILILTHGTNAESVDLWLTFRKPGDNAASCGKLIGQTTESAVGSGQRSGLAVWVPVDNGVINWCYRRYVNGVMSDAGSWPDYTSVGGNLSVLGWAR